MVLCYKMFLQTNLGVSQVTKQIPQVTDGAENDKCNDKEPHPLYTECTTNRKASYAHPHPPIQLKHPVQQYAALNAEQANIQLLQISEGLSLTDVFDDFHNYTVRTVIFISLYFHEQVKVEYLCLYFHEPQEQPLGTVGITSRRALEHQSNNS